MANPNRSDHPMRRRAISCSPNVGAARLLPNHTSSSAVNTPNRSYLSGQQLGPPSGRIGLSFGSLEQYSQFSDYSGETSALGFVPGPAVGYTQTETYLGNQQDRMPPEVVVSTDDLNPAPKFTSAGITAGIYGSSDGLGTPDKLESEQWETPVGTMGTYIDANPSIAPSFYQFREPVSTRDQNFLSAHRLWGIDSPPSPSAYSSSTSPISTFSGLGINSPQSTMGDVDESGSSRTWPMQEYQVQGENWGASSRVAEQVPVSPTSPSWSTSQAQPFGCDFLRAIPPMTPGSANTASIGTSDPLNITNLPNSIMEDSSLMAPIPAHPQSFPTEGPSPFTCLTGGTSDSLPIEALGAALQSERTEFLFSISTGTHGYQSSNVSGTNIINSPPSENPCIPRIAGPFSAQVNTSYERAVYGDRTYPISSMGASGSRSAIDNDAAQVLGHPKFKSRLTPGPTGKKCVRHRATSRANEVEKIDNNRLLHMSISALVDSGRIQQASALRETLRLIIQNCFLSDPTRQDIVDLLFDALPYDIRVIVAEPGVKKYYKERVGHILSAPANKDMFINSPGGRWSLGGPSH